MPLPLAQIDWNSLLQKPDTLPVLTIIAATVVITVVAIVAVQWRKARQVEYESLLKQRMIERGFTADEITRVVNARAGHEQGNKLADRLDCCNV